VKWRYYSDKFVILRFLEVDVHDEQQMKEEGYFPLTEEDMIHLPPESCWKTGEYEIRLDRQRHEKMKTLRLSYIDGWWKRPWFRDPFPVDYPCLSEKELSELNAIPDKYLNEYGKNKRDYFKSQKHSKKT
jgi:hypothetical protein